MLKETIFKTNNKDFLLRLGKFFYILGKATPGRWGARTKPDTLQLHDSSAVPPRPWVGIKFDTPQNMADLDLRPKHQGGAGEMAWAWASYFKQDLVPNMNELALLRPPGREQSL